MGKEASSEARTLFKSAWEAHAHGDDGEAEILFLQALALEPDSIDTMYGLGIVLKAMGRTQEAIARFEKIVNNIENQEWSDLNRARMLRRLALGQINYLKNQDWNLEKEV